MRILRRILEATWEIFGIATTLSSLAFMGFVFLAESFGGRMTYLEPNRAIAQAELGLTALGGVWVVAKARKFLTGQSRYRN